MTTRTIAGGSNRVVARRQEDLSDVLSEFARTMVTDFPIQQILDHLVRRIVDILPITGAGVTLIAPDLAPRFVAASNSAALRFERLQTDLGEGPCLAAYLTGTAISVPRLDGEPYFPRFSPQALSAGLVAVFTFPLNHGDLRLGALDLYRDTAGPLSTASMTTAQTLADVAAAYLINAEARSDLQDSSDRSREAALHDPLTGLANRTLLLERLDHAFLRGRRSSKTTALFFLDLDRFKTVNDIHGHDTGDELLVALSERLTAMLRPGDTLARLAGDEFVILCEDLADATHAETIAARIDAELAPPFALTTTQVKITASIGIAFTGRGADSPRQLLHDADLAMYRAKRSRRPGRHVFDLRELHRADDRVDLALALPGALGRGELHLVYQPIVAAADGRLTGLEAFLRWTSADRGPIPPSVLISLADQLGVINEIGRWVLEQACTDSHPAQPGRARPIAVAVNVSAQQFMSAGFSQTIASVLAQTSTEPHLLTLDVSESVLVSDDSRALIVLEELRRVGVKVALDDFGTGISSLNSLTRFGVETVKVDREIVTKLARDPASRAILTAVIDIAHGLGMSVVAEGVETAAQHDETTRLGCDYCQGYYFAKPLPASKLTMLLRPDADGGNPRLPTAIPPDPFTPVNEPSKRASG
jgi:diguanylate cyclase (GGDEF)-like protein